LPYDSAQNPALLARAELCIRQLFDLPAAQTPLPVAQAKTPE
jgi:hypothetical protein